MGQATILASLGEGLYRVQLDYDLTTLNGELARLQAAQDAHFAELLQALLTLDRARQATAEATAAANAVLEQWKQALISESNENPPPLVPPDPNDPGTGEPWVDPDRAQEPLLLDAINAARVSAGVATLSRASQLDAAMLALMRTVAAQGRITHVDALGYGPEGRVAAQGYLYDEAIGVKEALALGASTPEAAVDSILRSTDTKAALLHPDVSDVGIAYVYRAGSPYSHHWGAVLATPGAGPITVSFEENPAQAAADAAGEALDKIPVPTVSATQPEKLSAACALAQRALAEERAADAAVTQLLIDSGERSRRIDRLTALKTASLTPIEVWACRFIEDAPAGAVVSTAEPPGDYRRDTQARVTIMGQRNDPDHLVTDTSLSYTEHRVNLIPPSVAATGAGRLRHAEVMSDAAVFVNLAMEPGHLKWKPIWRYGTLTAVSGNLCSLTLDTIDSRGAEGLPTLPLDEVLALSNVPISYPPCNGEVFEIGDAVLVLFEGYSRDAPKVVGFRREPRPCPGGRVSWGQLR